MFPGDSQFGRLRWRQRLGLEDRVYVHAVKATLVSTAALRLGTSSVEGCAEHRRKAHPGFSK